MGGRSLAATLLLAAALCLGACTLQDCLAALPSSKDMKGPLYIRYALQVARQQMPGRRRSWPLQRLGPRRLVAWQLQRLRQLRLPAQLTRLRRTCCLCSRPHWQSWCLTTLTHPRTWPGCCCMASAAPRHGKHLLYNHAMAQKNCNTAYGSPEEQAHLFMQVLPCAGSPTSQ